DLTVLFLVGLGQAALGADTGGTFRATPATPANPASGPHRRRGPETAHAHWALWALWALGRVALERRDVQHAVLEVQVVGLDLDTGHGDGGLLDGEDLRHASADLIVAVGGAQGVHRELVALDLVCVQPDHAVAEVFGGQV